MCEEYESYHDWTGRPVARGQYGPSFVSSVIKTNKLWNDDLANEEFLLQRYRERIEKLSQKTHWANFVLMQDSWLQLKSDSISWRTTLKNSHNSQIQWSVVSTPCQETKIHLKRKGWIRGNTKIGPVLEVATSYLHVKYGVEIRIKSVNKDNSHSWIRIYHDVNKLVTDLNNKDEDDSEQKTSEIQFEGFNTLQLSDQVKSLLYRLWEVSKTFTGKIVFYVDVQRHFLWNTRQWRRMFGKFSTRIFVCKKIWTRTESEKKWYSMKKESTRNLDQNCRKDVVGIRRKRMSNFSCYDSIVQRWTQKQRTRQTVDLCCCLSGNDWD